jgi:hypothetical protein
MRDRDVGALPNFIIGGTAAGGTSFLAAAMVQHPQIYLPKTMRPEPHYFYKSWEYIKGVEYYKTRWFSEVAADQKAIGERSSSYLFGGREVAKKIHAVLPEVKLIFTLRNPVERTWANYRYTVLEGLEPLSFEEALERERERVLAQKEIWAEIQPHNYTGRGMYAKQLREFLEFFPAKQILLVKSEEMGQNPHQELARVFAFLDVSSSFLPALPPDHTSMNVIDPKLQVELRSYFGDRFDLVIECIRKEQDPRQIANSPTDLEQIRKLSANLCGRKMEMSPDCRAYLRRVFAYDMANLRDVVPFDISDWQ